MTDIIVSKKGTIYVKDRPSLIELNSMINEINLPDTRLPGFTEYQDTILPDGKITVWDNQSIKMFQGPTRQAQYSFEIKENIVKRLLRKLRIIKKKQSLISEEWHGDLMATMKKEMASIGWSEEFTLAKYEPDIFKMWIERIEKERTLN